MVNNIKISVYIPNYNYGNYIKKAIQSLLKQTFKKFLGVVDSVRVGIRRPDDNFRDVLKKAKNAHKYNTINDF